MDPIKIIIYNIYNDDIGLQELLFMFIVISLVYILIALFCEFFLPWECGKVRPIF